MELTLWFKQKLKFKKKNMLTSSKDFCQLMGRIFVQMLQMSRAKRKQIFIDSSNEFIFPQKAFLFFQRRFNGQIWGLNLDWCKS